MMSRTVSKGAAARPCRLAILNSHPIQYLAPLYRRLAAEPEIELTVFYCSRAGAEPYIDAGFGEVVDWGPTVMEGYRWRFLTNLWGEGPPRGFWSLVNPGLFRELVRGRFDALWVHGYSYATHLAAILTGRALGCRVLFRGDTRAGLGRSGLRRTLRVPVLRRLYGRCDAVLTIGSGNERFYRELGIPDDRLFPVPYTVDNDFFRRHAEESARNRAAVRRELGIPRDVPVVCFVGKLTLQKRPMDLLRAARRLERSGRSCCIVLAGSGPEAPRLNAYAGRHGLRLRACGLVGQVEVARILGVSDVFVLPSKDEAWGLVVNEAMSAGLPIVVSDEVGAGEDLVRDGVNGFRYRTGDVDALTGSLRRLVTDPKLRSRMGAASFRIIDGWDLESTVSGVRRALQGPIGARAMTVPARPNERRAHAGAEGS